MKEILSNSAYFGVFISLLSYFLGVLLKKRFKSALFNPILIAIILTACAILVLGIDYDTYNAGGKYLSWLLTPATVCLAIPLYEQFTLLKQNLKAIMAGILAGVLTSLVSIFLLSLLFGLDHAGYVTLLPKSITTAIGMSLADEFGGYAAISCAAIIITGITGNIIAEGFLKLIKVTEPIARGIAIGTSSHAIGTAKAAEMGNIEGAMSGLALAIAGLVTVIAASIFAQFI